MKAVVGDTGVPIPRRMLRGVKEVEIRKRRVAFVTTSYVFDEVVTFFNSRDHHAKRSQSARYCSRVPCGSHSRLKPCPTTMVPMRHAASKPCFLNSASTSTSASAAHAT